MWQMCLSCNTLRGGHDTRLHGAWQAGRHLITAASHHTNKDQTQTAIRCNRTSTMLVIGYNLNECILELVNAVSIIHDACNTHTEGEGGRWCTCSPPLAQKHNIPKAKTTLGYWSHKYSKPSSSFTNLSDRMQQVSDCTHVGMYVRK